MVQAPRQWQIASREPPSLVSASPCACGPHRYMSPCERSTGISHAWTRSSPSPSLDEASDTLWDVWLGLLVPGGADGEFCARCDRAAVCVVSPRAPPRGFPSAYSLVVEYVIGSLASAWMRRSASLGLSRLRARVERKTRRGRCTLDIESASSRAESSSPSSWAFSGTLWWLCTPSAPETPRSTARMRSGRSTIAEWSTPRTYLCFSTDGARITSSVAVLRAGKSVATGVAGTSGSAGGEAKGAAIGGATCGAACCVTGAGGAPCSSCASRLVPDPREGILTINTMTRRDGFRPKLNYGHGDPY